MGKPFLVAFLFLAVFCLGTFSRVELQPRLVNRPFSLWYMLGGWQFFIKELFSVGVTTVQVGS